MTKSKPLLRLYFTDFWSNFNKQDNFFTRILSKDFELVITEDNPDLIIYSWEGRDFINYDCIRIYYTPENYLQPKYKECDFSLSFEYWDDPRNMRMPNYLLYEIHPDQLVKREEDMRRLVESRDKFCSMVVSNPNTPKRNVFFEKLSEYKQVDSGGKYKNNVGGRVANKREFISQYKFNIAFENSSYPGYTTEKILEAMVCNTIPIYWGNPLIHYEFNTKSFFNYNDYPSEEDLIVDIIEHDKDPDKYFKKLMLPWFEDGIPNQYFDNQRIRKFLYDIVSRKDNYTPIAKNKFKKYFYYPVGYQVNMMKARVKSIFR